MRLRPKDLERWTLWTVVLHTAVVTVHSGVHVALGIGIPTVQDAAFIAWAFFAGPILGALLIRIRPGLAGLFVMASMGAGAVYGAAYHFVFAGPDNVATVAPEGWGLAFRATSGALGVLEGIGTLLGLLLLVMSLRAGRKEGTSSPDAKP